MTVTLDGFPDRPLGVVGPLDLHWSRPTTVDVGQRVTAEVVDVDVDGCRVRLAMTATEHPELWAFLKGRRQGEIMSGTVAAIERFGVFVALDEGPEHPVFPGVGFISMAELSWRPFEAASDVVRVGQRVSCEFLQFDTTNGEARLSLKATRPDPFDALGGDLPVGRALPGKVTKLLPFGACVEIADGVEGFVHLTELSASPVATPEEVVAVGDEVTVVVTAFHRTRRAISLSLRRAREDTATS
ncbi:S1 RNA-binding domain-containing protein [Streptomyces sp. NPDC058955]|uniref:S1 RNA-binding domain-containing protein n=1 Tax=unclassified Streptomyces TaxID=2593676 RepID=UPI00365FB462